MQQETVAGLWVANLESLVEELKSLQDHIEEYVSEEDYSTDLSRFMDYQCKET